MKRISTLLIANRGEIACRIIKTAKKLGIRTVAVYSDADARAPHVRYADDRYRIGLPPVGESYLLAANILEAAKASGADAIHPGYGFLSENADFAEAVTNEGIVFVGPPQRAIEVMGDKARSKRAMIEAGVPCIPGYQGTDQSDETLMRESESVGFPLMVKAAAGGGGRGMRLVHDAGDLGDAIKLARSEAQNAFGSGDLIIEKAIIKPRHVEIQIFGDEHGNIIHLGERDCSVQRRHQKVLEEAPCPVMTPQLRVAMGAAAVNAARAVDYVGAGTVEFLLADDGSFYFLEMNTRLQVEHPVTELVTGLDLVELQLTVAEGHPLPLSQEQLVISGHAIEARLYAEDAEANFLPSTGPVELFLTPTEDGLRVDAGVETGGEVSPFYDPMVAKIIANGKTREEARRKLANALGRSALVGVKNNRDFLIDAIARDDFVRGEATTAFVASNYGAGGFVAEPLSDLDYIVAAATQYTLRQRHSLALAPTIDAELLYWGSSGQLRSVFTYGDDENSIIVSVSTTGSAELVCTARQSTHKIEVLDVRDNSAHLLVDGNSVDVSFFEHDANTLTICDATRTYRLTDFSGGKATEDEAKGGGTVVAPMHGRLIEVLVDEGKHVQKGDKLAVLEAMKMQHEILAEIDGEVVTVFETVGQQLVAGAQIMQIETLQNAD